MKIPSGYTDDTSSGQYAEFRELFSKRYFWVSRQEFLESFLEGFWNQSEAWREITQGRKESGDVCERLSSYHQDVPVFDIYNQACSQVSALNPWLIEVNVANKIIVQ